VGKFDILADHANFFSMITEGDIIVHTPVEELKFPVDKGIVKVTKNIVTFFVNIEPAYSNQN
jgi:F0F1-type ATP synthase epsilon subunit